MRKRDKIKRDVKTENRGKVPDKKKGHIAAPPPSRKRSPARISSDQHYPKKPARRRTAKKNAYKKSNTFKISKKENAAPAKARRSREAELSDPRKRLKSAPTIRKKKLVTSRQR